MAMTLGIHSTNGAATERLEQAGPPSLAGARVRHPAGSLAVTTGCHESQRRGRTSPAAPASYSF